MKKLITFTLGNLIGIIVATQLLTGITVTGGFVAYIILATVISLINWGVKPILTFLTLPINLLTFGLFNIVFNIVLFYAVSLIVPGYEITTGEFVGINTSFFVIPPWNTSLIATIVLGSIVIGLMASLVEWLLKS